MAHLVKGHAIDMEITEALEKKVSVNICLKVLSKLHYMQLEY